MLSPCPVWAMFKIFTLSVGTGNVTGYRQLPAAAAVVNNGYRNAVLRIESTRQHRAQGDAGPVQGSGNSSTFSVSSRISFDAVRGWTLGSSRPGLPERAAGGSRRFLAHVKEPYDGCRTSQRTSCLALERQEQFGPWQPGRVDSDKKPTARKDRTEGGGPHGLPLGSDGSRARSAHRRAGIQERLVRYSSGRDSQS